MIEYVWYYDDNDRVYAAKLISLGAHASHIEYVSRGLTWNILASNDDIEFIGENRIDDED